MSREIFKQYVWDKMDELNQGISRIGIDRMIYELLEGNVSVYFYGMDPEDMEANRETDLSIAKALAGLKVEGIITMPDYIVSDLAEMYADVLMEWQKDMPPIKKWKWWL